MEAWKLKVQLQCTFFSPELRGEGFPRMLRDDFYPRAKVVLIRLSACKAEAPGFVHNSVGPRAGSSCILFLPPSGCFGCSF